MASRLWNFLTLDIGELVPSNAADSGLHDADAVIGLAEVLAAEGGNIQKLVPLITQLDSLLDALNSPLREIEELDLSFVPIGRALLQLYRDQTEQEPTAAQKVALISQVAYLEAVKSLLAEPQLEPWLAKVGDLAASNAVRQKIQRLKAIELGETEARRTLRSFQGSALAAAYSEVLIARFSELGIEPRQAGKIAVKLAHQAQEVMLSMSDSYGDRSQRSARQSPSRNGNQASSTVAPRSQPRTAPSSQKAALRQSQATLTRESEDTGLSLFELFEHALSELAESSSSETGESSESGVVNSELDSSFFEIFEQPPASENIEPSPPEKTESPVAQEPEASSAEAIESSPVAVETEPVPDAIHSPQPENLKPVLQEIFEQSVVSEVTESSLSEEVEPPLPADIEEPMPQRSEQALPAIAEEPLPATVKLPLPEVTEPSLPGVVEPFLSKVTESSRPEEIEPPSPPNVEEPVPNVEPPNIDPTLLESLEQSLPGNAESPTLEEDTAVNATLPEEIDPTVLDFLERPLPEATEPSFPEVIEPSFPEVTELSLAEVVKLAPPEGTYPPPETMVQPSPPQVEPWGDKKLSIETYLKEWIAPRPHEQMFGEAFSFKDIYIPLRAQPLMPLADVDAGQATLDLAQWVQLQLRDNTQRGQVMVIQGEPGRGKSLFCRLLADWVRSHEYPRWTPILIHLSDLVELSETFEETLAKAIGWDFAQTGTDWLTDPTIKFLFLLDGLDELQTADTHTGWTQFWEQVGQFQEACAQDPQKGHQVLLTTRSLAVEAVADSLPTNLARVAILPMNDALQQQWYKRWTDLVGPQKLSLMAILRNPNLPDWVRKIAQEPLLMYLLAAIHRGGELKLEKLVSDEKVQTEILIYDRILTWLLTQRRLEGRNRDLIQLSSANLRHILKEVGLCMMQPEQASAAVPVICDRLTQGSAASALPETVQSHLTTDTLRLKNELATFYCRPRQPNADSLEFAYKRWGELLHIERIATGLVTLCLQEEGKYAIADSAFCWILYDLLSSTELTPEVTPYLMAMLIMSPKFAPERLQKRLYIFYWRWCRGEFIDAPAETLPQRTLRLLLKVDSKQPYAFGQRQIDAQMGLNILILLLEFHRYGHSLAAMRAAKETDPENTLFFHPCSRPDYDQFEVQQLLEISNISRCLGPDAFRERLRLSLYGIDLRGADLNHIDFRSINLKGANLHSVDLNHADLSEANLSRANLRSANLNDATLRKADLRGVYLRSAQLFSADLSEVNLSKANLNGVDLRRARLTGANLSGADMTQANLNSADLRGCNLCKTDLNTAILPQADLTDANLSEANLGNANLSGANLIQARLSGANLSRANLSEMDLRGADLSGVDLSGADLSGANLTDANLSGANLSGANLQRTNFHKANLKEASLKGAHLNNTNFNGADLSEASMSGLNLSSINFDSANLTDVSLRRLDLSHANLRSAKLTGVDLCGANLSGADLRNAELTNASLIGANLFEVNLFEADLSEADFHSADLFEAKLISATLKGTNLDSANLSHTNFFEADLSEANLTQADLFEANLSNANLSGAILSGANLNSVNFFEANLSGADLSDAYLFKAILSNTNLTNANLGGADFSGADCSSADLTEAIFFGKDGAIQWDDGTSWDDVDGLDTVIGLQEVLDQRLGTSSASKQADSDLLF